MYDNLLWNRFFSTVRLIESDCRVFNVDRRPTSSQAATFSCFGLDNLEALPEVRLVVETGGLT